MDGLDKLYIYRIPTKILDTIKHVAADAILSQSKDVSGHSSEEELEESDDESGDEHEPSPLGQEEKIELLGTSVGSPIAWFTASSVPFPKKLGIYRTMFPGPGMSLQSLQLANHKSANSSTGRTIAMFMVGGGHFQGTIISLNESSITNCAIKASKGFHRYTTRRKQGGAQSANDNANGAANSAGAQIRRYNEVALADDIRTLLNEWKQFLDQVELILVRASGQASRKLLYDNGLNKSDERIRKFPINTRRATQAEIIRSFHILTRVQVGSLEDDKIEIRPVAPKDPVKQIKPAKVEVDPALVLHSEKMCALIRRSKAPGLREYILSNDIQVATFCLQPAKTFVHTPSLLHYASANDSHAAIGELLNCGADPGTTNDAGKTPFEVANSKSIRDAFRLWRGKDGHESKWDWEAARVPVGLTEDQVRARQARENETKAAADALETQRREAEMKRLEKEASDAKEKQQQEAEVKRGPGKFTGGALSSSTSANLDGLTPEMRRKVEREQRARAAMARFAKK